MKTLIGYASKHGATAEIAAYMGEVLREQAVPVDVVPVGNVTNLARYDAIIVGSATYSQQWMPAATQFLTMRADILARKPVWLFSSGPTGEGNATELLGGFTFPENLQTALKVIEPQDVMVFHGKLDLTKLTLAELMIVKRYGGPLGDYRKWDKIEQWALKIVDYLATAMPDFSASA